MATTLSYNVAPYVPFTKILSANANQDKTDIKNRLNWDGSGTTTGLGDDNLQSNSVSGGGLTRSSKLKAGTASHVIINDGSGLMSSEAALAITRGGTGLSITIGSQTAGDVFQVNAAGNAIILSQPSAVPSSLKIFQFYNFS